MSTSIQELQFITEWADGPPATLTAEPEYQRRALFIWPGLDRARLRRTHGDPWKIARLVAHRSSLSIESILTLLMGVGVAPEVPGPEGGDAA